MGVIIGIMTAVIGAQYCNIDFCDLYTFTSMSISIYESMQKVIPMIKRYIEKNTPR